MQWTDDVHVNTDKQNNTHYRVNVLLATTAHSLKDNRVIATATYQEEVIEQENLTAEITQMEI